MNNKKKCNKKLLTIGIILLIISLPILYFIFKIYVDSYFMKECNEYILSSNIRTIITISYILLYLTLIIIGFILIKRSKSTALFIILLCLTILFYFFMVIPTLTIRRSSVPRCSSAVCNCKSSEKECLCNYEEIKKDGTRQNCSIICDNPKYND